MLTGLLPGEAVRTAARREGLRFLAGPRSTQGLVCALAAACLLALLIPLHRAFGQSPLSPGTYFLLYALGIQAACFGLAARAVWLSTRQDAAAGTLDELLLAGLGAPAVLYGKWLGVTAAGALWASMLLPAGLLAGAFTGMPAGAVLAAALCWSAAAAAGGLSGTALTFSERTSSLTSIPLLVFGLQAWFMLRWVFPRIGSGMGPLWSEALLWVQRADPLTLLPAAVGLSREPWPLKVAVLALLMGGALAWLAARTDDLPLRATGQEKPPGDLFSLRPARAWLIGERSGARTDYGADVAYDFERAHGWRLRVSPVAWLCFLAAGLIPTGPLGILGREGHGPVVAVQVMELWVAAGISALGVAAALASEREQGRWLFLLGTPLSPEQLVRAKWRAAWIESWPLWAAGALRAVLMGLAGALPWGAVPVAMVAAPAAAGAAAGLAAGLCVRAPTLAAAQQRALLLLVLPPAAVFAAGWLLPELRGPGYLSLPHLVGAALRFQPPFGGPAAALAGLALYALAGALGVAAAAWQLRRWPPA